MLLLNTDIKSYCSGKLYGMAGESVKVISLRGNVAIVENVNKNRFPVRVDRLEDYNPDQPIQAAVVQAQKNKPEKQNIIQNVQPKRKAQTVSNNQTQLF